MISFQILFEVLVNGKDAPSVRSTALIPPNKNSVPFHPKGAFPFAPKNLTPMKHQKIAFKKAIHNLKANQPVYLALDPGLGKTIVAAMISNYFKGYEIFYVCPPFLTSNTDSEFEKWTFEKRLHLIPDSKIARQSTLDFLEERFRENSILIIDEAHRFKNATSKRSKALFKNILPHFKKVVFMSGTPMPNSRAKELWSILVEAAPKIFGKNFFAYGLKYCGAFKGEFGWNFDGYTNRKEHRARLQKSFMIRMKKELLKLPEKHEGLLTVGEGMPPVLSKVEKKVLEHYSPRDLMEGVIAAKEGKGILHLMTYLRLLGEYKVKFAVPYIESILDETQESVLVFAFHKETIAKLVDDLKGYDPLVITGKVPKQKRQPIVDEFQKNPSRRLFIGNIHACGIGFTLTKATRVLFVEFDWVDGNNTQAADRAHRIGQNKGVLVQYVVLKDSFDRKRMEILLEKRSKSI